MLLQQVIMPTGLRHAHVALDNLLSRVELEPPRADRVDDADESGPDQPQTVERSEPAMLHVCLRLVRVSDVISQKHR